MIHDDALLENSGERDEVWERVELSDATKACLFEIRPSEMLALSGRELTRVIVRDISMVRNRSD